MADDKFVTAVGPDGKKRRVPRHYLDNPALGFKLPPSARTQRVREPANSGHNASVSEPATPENEEEASE